MVAILHTMIWFMLLLAVGLGGLTFLAALGQAKSAPQEAALGAVFSTCFIGAYVFVRCIEKSLTAFFRR